MASSPSTAQPGRSLNAGAAAGELADGPTTHIFVYDLDSNIPGSDLEQGLLGLFSVFGPVVRVFALGGWKDTAQAVVAFAKVDNATQAMERLQNFPIWGRPLRLAFANADAVLGQRRPDPAVGTEKDRPATAPQIRSRQTASYLSLTAGEDNQDAGVRRRICGTANASGLHQGGQDDVGNATLTPNSDRATESAMARFDRMVTERLMHSSTIPPPVRPEGPNPGTRVGLGDIHAAMNVANANAGQTDSVWDKPLLGSSTLELKKRSPKPKSPVSRGSPSWQDKMPEQLHPAHITSESTIEEHFDSMTDGGDGVGEELVSGLGISALSDVEAGSELPGATDSAEHTEHDDSEWSDSSDEKAGTGGRDGSGAAALWGDPAPAVDDLQEGEDYGDEGEVDIAALAALLGGAGEDSGKVAQLPEALNVARCMRELDQLMSSLNSLQEAEATLQDPGGGADEARGAREQDEAGQSLADGEEMLADVALRFSAIQSKLAGIPPQFFEALGGQAPQVYAASGAECTEHVGTGGECAGEEGSEIAEEYEQSSPASASALRRAVLPHSAPGAPNQESDTGDTGGSDDEIQNEAEAELEMRLGAQNLEDAMLTSELQRELEDLSHLQGQIAYLKEMLRKTKDQQRLLQDAEADEALSVPSSSVMPTEDEGDIGDGEDRDVPLRSSPLRPCTRDPLPQCDTEIDSEVGNDTNQHMDASADTSFDHVVRPHSRLSESRPQSRLSEGRPTSRLSWADEEGGRRYLPNEDMTDFACMRPSSRPTSRLSRLSESNASDSVCPTPDVDELDALLLQSRADLRDIRLAVLFTRTLGERADRLHFLADFIDHFQGRQAENGDSDFPGSFSGDDRRSRPYGFAAARGSHRGGDGVSGAGGGVGWNMDDNMWTAADHEEGAGEEEEPEDSDNGEEGASIASISRASSGLSGMGSAAWSKFSTLPRPSPRSASVSAGLGSNGSNAYSQVQTEDDPDCEEETEDGVEEEEALWGEDGGTTDLQVLKEIRSLPVALRGAALLAIRRLRLGADPESAESSTASAALRETKTPAHTSSSGRACFTKLTDTDDPEEDVKDEVPPGGAGASETENEGDDATASSWRSVDDVSNDSSLARLAHHLYPSRSAPGVTREGASRDSPGGRAQKLWTGAGPTPGNAGKGTQTKKYTATKSNISVSSSPSLQGTPHRRNNYFVDNLDLESPNKVPEDMHPCLNDDSDQHEGLGADSNDFILDLQARARANRANKDRSKPRHSGARVGGSSSAGSSSVSSSATPPREQTVSEARAALPNCGYDYAESVSSSTVPSELDGEPNGEDAGQGETLSDSSYRSTGFAGHGGDDLADTDIAIAEALHRRIQALVRERQGLGFSNVSFTRADLDGLAKLIERLLRNKGLTVDEQLRSMLHNALNKYCHTTIQEESSSIVQDVRDILQKERVFREVVARMGRGWEQEMRDYQQYPEDVRLALMEQLQMRRDRDMMRLEKERRARGHSHVQNVHSDSPDDSGSRGSMQSDDFDATLESAVQSMPSQSATQVRASARRSSSIDVSSSAECASEDTHSSSAGTVVEVFAETQSISSPNAKGMNGGLDAVGAKERQQRQSAVLEPEFHDSEFEEITIADLPDEPAHLGADGGRAESGSHNSTRGSKDGQGAGRNAIRFGPQGLRIPEELAGALERRRQEELSTQPLGGLPRDFVGGDLVDPLQFDINDHDVASFQKPRLTDLMAMQKDMLAAVNAMSEAMAAHAEQQGLTFSGGFEGGEAASTVSYAGTSGSDEYEVDDV